MNEQNLRHLFEQFNATNLENTLEKFFRMLDYFAAGIAPPSGLPTPERVQEVKLLGEFRFPENPSVPVLMVKLASDVRLQERSGKKYQFDMARALLKALHADSGLLVFFNGSQKAFRVSYVYSIFSGIRRTFSHYKRHSFFVSEGASNRTFLQQFSSCPFTSEADLLRAFSLEPVTREFYAMLEKWYYHALNHVKFPPDAEAQPNGRNIQLIRFITRIIFIWFLKARHILPQGLFDERQARLILRDGLDPDSSSYYLAILQNLFFATLNTPPELRKFRKADYMPGRNEDYMNHGVFRHHALLADRFTFEELFGNIPFLNGGIFDCLDTRIHPPRNGKKELRIDGFSDVKAKQPLFPNHLIFNSNPNCPGILNILSTFHFTIDENSSVDEDVALDPELLGNVFENLLASYNPETSKSARKNTGTYYTPREIVDFMCEQALLAYLKNKVPQADPEALEGLISDAEGVPPVPEEVRREIVKYVMECRILDPACGSGAFPMGMLHRMVKLLQKTDPDGRFMHKPESANDATRGQNVHNVIQKNADYHRKLFLIENCIYGTDIQPIAIQISKLRFFISLLVDEAIDPALPNMGLQPLPNLDIKFIIADALTPLKDVNVGNFVQEFVNDLKALMHEYFEAGTLENKNRLKEKFRVLKQKLVEMARDFGQEELATQMQEFNPFYADHVHAWFDGFLMFGVNNHAATNPHQGFDLVMGNPPYIQLQNDGGALGKKYEKFHYQTFARSGNIYVLFYEKGINLLKEGGHLCYITSNKWLRAGYGKKLRAYLCRWNPLLLVDLGPGVFKSATVDTNILLVEKRGRKPAGRKKGLQATEPFAMRALQAVKENGKVNLWEQMKTRGVVMEKLGDDAWFIGSSAEQRLKEKIERLGKPLKDWDVNIYYGIKTGLNEAFIISTEKRNEILANCKDEEEIKRTEAIIKPILRGRDIKRYYYEWAGLWIIGLFPTLNIDINNFHSLKNFLYKYKSALMGRAGDQKWFELQANSFFSDGSNYISWLELTNEPRFSIVEKEYYSLNSLTCLASSKHLKYLCGVLNSKVTFFYFDKICISSGVGTNQWRQAYVEKIPIPCVTQFNKFLIDQVEILVNNIYFAKKQNPQADTTEWEREIDRLVYQLYELTEEEVRIIEGSQ